MDRFSLDSRNSGYSHVDISSHENADASAFKFTNAESASRDTRSLIPNNLRKPRTELASS